MRIRLKNSHELLRPGTSQKNRKNEKPAMNAVNRVRLLLSPLERSRKQPTYRLVAKVNPHVQVVSSKGGNSGEF